MSKRIYPRFGGSREFTRGKCRLCGLKSVAKVDIQVNYMRGDDDVFAVCEEHRLQARNKTAEFWRDILIAAGVIKL